jgi:hypothetical protein
VASDAALSIARALPLDRISAGRLELELSEVERAVLDETRARLGVLNDADLLRVALWKVCGEALGKDMPAEAFELPLRSGRSYSKLARALAGAAR